MKFKHRLTDLKYKYDFPILPAKFNVVNEFFCELVSALAKQNHVNNKEIRWLLCGATEVIGGIERLFEKFFLKRTCHSV